MRSRRSRGFTLLEVLVAITIFSLVVSVLYAGYRLGVRSWETGERTHEAVSELRLAGAFVRSHASEAFPLAISRNNAWRLWFAGEPDRLVFITAMPTYLGQGGMYEMTLGVEEDEGDASLTVSRRLLHPDAEPGTPGVEDGPRTLVDRLESATFAYFGAPSENAEPSWHTRWVDRQRLPMLVRLRLASHRVGDWPELIIRLPTDAVRYQRTVAPGGPGAAIPATEPLPGGDSLLAPGLAQ